MFKKMFFRTAICLSLIFAIQQNSYSQNKTKDELKAEREVLKSEMKSKDADARKAKFEKLSAPSSTGLASVDQLATSATAMLISTKNVNTIVPEMYKRTIGESVDGVTDVTVKKPTLDELVALGANIATQVVAVTEASKIVEQATGDVKTLSPLQAPKALKSLNFSKDVISLVAPELALSLKVVNNLIATMKAKD